MSEPDAVPLPRDGEVFFDVRGEARSMRLSWYADSKVAVFSIWQGNRCTGTFRLPFVDLARMVQTLQSGPPVPAQPAQPRGGVPADAMTQSGHYGPDPRFGGSPADWVGSAPDLAGAGHSHGGQAFGDDLGHGPGPYQPQPYAPEPYAPDPYAPEPYSHEPYSHEPYSHEPYGHEPYGPGYGAAAAHAAGQDYRAGHGYGTESDFAAAPAYAADRPYARDPYHQGDPYGGSGPYGGTVTEYPGGEPYRPAEPYRPTERHSISEPYRAARHGTDKTGPGVPDYDPPNYGEPPRYRDARAAGPPPKRVADSESVPDTAMMSFPSVPARNGPSGYR
jgi:hypothetical protein